MIDFTLDELKLVMEWAEDKATAAIRAKKTDKYKQANEVWKKAHDEYYKRVYN